MLYHSFCYIAGLDVFLNCACSEDNMLQHDIKTSNDHCKSGDTSTKGDAIIRTVGIYVIIMAKNICKK